MVTFSRLMLSSAVMQVRRSELLHMNYTEAGKGMLLFIMSEGFCVHNCALLAPQLRQQPLTILMNADRKTMTMVKTPTRVLFIRDCTILLEMVCRGTGKTWAGKRRGKYESLNEWF